MRSATCNSLVVTCFKSLEKNCKKREHSARVVIFVTHTSSTSALFYKVLVQRLRQQQGKPTLSRNFARQSLFLKTRWCPVQIQIQRTNTRRQNHGKLVTTARDGVMTLRMPVYLRCPATVAGFLTTQSFTPFSGETYHHHRYSLISVWYEISWRRRYLSEVNFEWSSSSWDQTWQLTIERWTSWHVGWLGTSR